MKYLEQQAQGDFLISQIRALPEGIKLTEIKREVVGVGEQSGHNHVLVPTDEKSKVMFFRDESGIMYFNVAEGMATLGHWLGDTTEKADHEALTFAPGFYVIHPQREYDELGERRVQD